MYAPGYTILENNRPYIEREDELDRLPPVRGCIPVLVFLLLCLVGGGGLCGG